MFTSDTEDSISTAAGLHDLVTTEMFPARSRTAQAFGLINQNHNDPFTSQAVPEGIPVSSVERRITMRPLSALITHIRFACRHLQPMSVRHLIYDASPAHWPIGDRTAALSPHDDLPAEHRPETLPSANPHHDIDNNHRPAYQAAPAS